MLFFGSQKLYLNRHIKRAYIEAKEKLDPILANRKSKEITNEKIN